MQGNETLTGLAALVVMAKSREDLMNIIGTRCELILKICPANN